MILCEVALIPVDLCKSAFCSPPPPPQFQEPEKLENTTEYVKRTEPVWKKADEDQYPVRNTRNVHFDKKARTEAYRNREFGKKKGSALGHKQSLEDIQNSATLPKWVRAMARAQIVMGKHSASINGDKQEPSPQGVIHG